MIKQWAAVTKQYCKHANQSSAPSELPPQAVMRKKMEKQPRYWAPLMKNGLTSHLEIPPANKTPAPAQSCPTHLQYWR